MDEINEGSTLNLDAISTRLATKRRGRRSEEWEKRQPAAVFIPQVDYTQ